MGLLPPPRLAMLPCSGGGGAGRARVLVVVVVVAVVELAGSTSSQPATAECAYSSVRCAIKSIIEKRCWYVTEAIPCALNKGKGKSGATVNHAG
jgi:hypothetical protein